MTLVDPRYFELCHMKGPGMPSTRQTIRAVMFCACLILPAAVRAGDGAVGHLPHGMLAGVSVRSPYAVLQAFDQVAVAASAGTSREVPPGGAMNLVRLYGLISPLGLKNWDQDGEAHVYFHGDLFDKPERAFVIAVKDFDAFVGEIGSRHPPVVHKEESDAHRVKIPMAGTLLAADLGEGCAVLASDEMGLALIRMSWAAGWRPLHWALGVVGAELVPPEGWREENVYLADPAFFLQLLTGALEEERKTLEEAGPRPGPGFGPDEDSLVGLDVALGIADALRVFAPDIVRELDGFRRLAVDIGVDEYSVAADFLLAVDGDTLTGKMAARAMDRGVMDVDFAGMFAESAEALVFNAPVEELAPGAADAAAKATELCLARLMGADGAEAGEVARNFVGHLLGAGVFALRDGGDGRQLFFKSMTSQPAAARESFLSLFAMSNRLGDLLEGMESGKAYVRFSIDDMETPGGMGYSRIAVTPESLAKAAMTLPNPLVRMVVSNWFRSFAMYGAAGDGFFAVGTGLRDAEAVLGAFERGVGRSDWEEGAAAAREAAAVAKPQILLSMFRLDGFESVMRDLVLKGRGAGEAARMVPGAFRYDMIPAAFTKAQAGFRRNAGLSTFSAGGSPDGPVAELRVSLDALNAIYGNWYLYKNELSAMVRAKADAASADAGPAIDKKDISVFGDGGGF